MAERKDDISQDQPFLSRWSERKQRAELDAEGNRPDANSERVEGADAGTVDEEQAANQAAAEAIDIDSLDEDSDYSPFFKDGVPPALKSAALQRLWRSSPVFANIDGLNDYDEDFTIPKTPMGAIKTAWKFGRGFITDDDADKGEIIPEPEMAEAPEIAAGPEAGQSGEDNEETVAEAVISHPDPADDHDSESDPAPDPQSEDATGEKPDPHPAPGVGLRNRLDMAAFSGREDD